MNIQKQIGYNSKELNEEELRSLSSELEDYELKEYSSNDQIDKDLSDEKILAIAKKINDTPYYDSNHALVIGALLPRITKYDQSIREQLPINGDGILCLVTKKSDLVTRKKLAEINDAETMYCSNVERALLKEFPKAQVHCRLDRAQRYNLGIFIKTGDESKVFYYSQSTFVGLVNRAINEIKEA